jgi:RNA polymerase sigma-70 factor, ECF subfamily
MNEWATQAAQGDREAMTKIVAEHYPPVVAFCARRVGVDAAPDAAQETFLIAWKNIGKFEGRSRVQTWIFGIAHQVCRNAARKRRQELRFEMPLATDPPAASAEGQLIHREALRSALLKLTPEHREVILLHEIEGLTYEEAATMLDVPVGTVKSRLNAAFMALRRLLVAGEPV